MKAALRSIAPGLPRPRAREEIVRASRVGLGRRMSNSVWVKPGGGIYFLVERRCNLLAASSYQGKNRIVRAL